MTTEEALDALIAKNPGKTYCVRYVTWSHLFEGKHARLSHYEVSIVDKNKPVEIYSHATLDVLIGRILNDL